MVKRQYRRRQKQQQPSSQFWSQNAPRLTRVRVFGSAVVTGLMCTSLSFSHRSPHSSLEPIDSFLPVRKEQTPPQAEQAQEPAAIEYNRTKYHYTPPSQSFGGPHSSCGVTDNNNPPTYESFFALDSRYRSRDKEDKIIWQKFFASMGKRGTYVEMGAYNGMHETNSRFFDVCLGWKGLLIEANPVMFPEVPASRPQAHSMSFAPSCQQPDQTLEFHATLWTNAGVAGLAKAYEGEETVKVPCGPLQPVLEDIFAGGEAIDFFSLDVEGAEPLVLETIDFTKVQIHVMLIEVANSFCKKEDCEQRNHVREIMKKAGYQQYKGMVSGSDVFVHPNSPYQLA